MSSKRSSFAATVFVLAALLCLTTLPAAASVITAFGGASGPGLASMSFNEVVTPAAGNDDVAGASPNYVSINQKAFGAVDYIDMVFIVEDFGVPTTEYVFVEGCANDAGAHWIGHEVILGFGTGVDFIQSAVGDGLDFDTPDYNSPVDFTPLVGLTVDEDVISAIGGIVADGSFNIWTFTVDVPNGISEFTVRQRPRTEPVPTESTIWSQVKSLFR